jgi:D-3-phosphoglycerate dehydrogenase
MDTSLRKEFAMKNDVGIVNCARGGVIDEVALVSIRQRKSIVCWIDVLKTNQLRNDYFNEFKISLTPHIGAATGEAQDRIGILSSSNY